MPIRPDLQQLEKCIDDALRKNDFRPLKSLLQIDICEDVKIKCSKQLFHKLDDLVCRELSRKDVQAVSLILISLGRCGKNISILGQAGLLIMMKQGLVQKEIILSQGNSKDEMVINMVEDLFDLLMVIHDVNDEGKTQVMESFIPRICALVIDSRVNICIQQETLKKMNAMLDRMPQEAKKILSKQEMLILMSNMGERILDAGDYDLQVGIVEALCRMTTERQRQELACQWFSMGFIADAFKGIKDSEFETDCRIFLNLVNGMLGDKRRVFTFPCLSAFLDKYELKIPSDEKLEEFWIDFNLGSQTLSFYIAGDNDDHQWEAVTVPEEKVQIYSVEVRESKKLLTIILNNRVKISTREGKELFLYFDASLDIANVTQKVFGADKYREFARKQGISVAKTSVHILFDATGSQILVPESQVSPVEEELLSLKEKSNSQKEVTNPPKCSKRSNQGDRRNSSPLQVTPSKRKMSEASMIVPGSDRYTVRSPILLINTSTPRRGRTKPPLPVMRSAKKPGIPKMSENKVRAAASFDSRPLEGKSKGDNTDKRIKTAQNIEKTENQDKECPGQNFNELQGDVPDTRAVGKIGKPVLPGVLDNMCGDKMHSKLACWTPVTNIELCNNQQTSTSSGITFNRGITNKKPSKQMSSSSMSDNSEEIGKVPYQREIMQPKNIDKEEVRKKNSEQMRNDTKHLEQKNIENTKQDDWHIESATTFKSVLLNKTIEESLIYRKKYVLSKDTNTAVGNRDSSKTNAKGNRKPRKGLTSEDNVWDLRQKKKRETSKGKGFTGVAESLIRQINTRYTPKDGVKSAGRVTEPLIDGGFSNKSDLHLSKEKVQKKTYRQLKTTFVNVTSDCPLDDVYNFNLNGADEPIIKLGIQEFQTTATEACMDNSIKLVGLRNHGAESCLKTKDKRIVTKQQKKNPFSDSDTEFGDDSRTDVSWLREATSKPQLVDYSRNKKAKKRETRKSSSSLERKPRLKMTYKKNTTKKIDETVPNGRTRLPRIATKSRKNYKDLSNSESESEEFSHSYKEKLLVKSCQDLQENSHSRSGTRKLPGQQQNTVSVGAQKNEGKSSSVSEKSLGVSPLSSSGSPSSVEVMRFEVALRCESRSVVPALVALCPEASAPSSGTEKITEKDFTQDYDCIMESLSPYPKTSPESLTSESGEGPVKSPQKSEKNRYAKDSTSPTPQSYSLYVRQIKRVLPYLNQIGLSPQLFSLPLKLPETKKITESKRQESRSASPLSKSSNETERMRRRVLCNTTHVLGPVQRISRKRVYTEDDPSPSREADSEENGSGALLPSKLSRTEDADLYTDEMSESVSPLSMNDFPTPEEKWESEIPNVGMMCEKINTEFQRKCTTRQKIVEYFYKHSWKTAHHHVKTMNHQIQEYRIKHLDKFQITITEELENFERDSQSLKDLEKEFVSLWEKIFQKFKICQKGDQQRLHLLKASLDKNVFYNTDHEETVFTSGMCLLKEDMKMLQDKLLKEMQQEELLNVRRGLMSLFLTHDRDALA